jgi:hypothetical protein
MYSVLCFVGSEAKKKKKKKSAELSALGKVQQRIVTDTGIGESDVKK